MILKELTENAGGALLLSLAVFPYAQRVNLAALITDHRAETVALHDVMGQVTYGELRDLSCGLRGGLLRAGIEPGDRVAVVCANTRYFVVSYLAVVGAGMIAVPLNPLSPAPELQRELSAVEARAVIVGPAGRQAISDIDLGVVPSLECVIGCPGVELGDRATHLFDELVSGEPASVADVEPDTVAVLMFTSGTAGLPKAAMLTHDNLEINQRQTLAHSPEGFLPDDIAYGVLPLFHIFGLNTILGTSLRLGATVVLAQRFDPESLVESIVEQGVNLVAGPPTMWLALTGLPDDARAQFASVRTAISGAAKLPTHIAEAVADRLGIELAEGYGLTEAAPSLATSLGVGAPRGSVGRPVPAVEMRIVDESGDDVLIGDPGEIIARGPNIFPGYWNDDDATARVLDVDGWLHTGDIAVVDEQGFISIIDRAKDLIIVSGFNVYPAEVETVLVEHRAVSQAAVVGVSNLQTDEAVKAFVVLDPDRQQSGVEEEELIAFCRAHLAAYKCPVKVNVVEDLPVGFGGKIRRRDLQ